MSELPTSIEHGTFTGRISDLLEDVETDAQGYVYLTPLAYWLPMPGETPGRVTSVKPVKADLTDGTFSVELLAMKWEARFYINGILHRPDPLIVPVYAAETVDLVDLAPAAGDNVQTETRTVPAAGLATRSYVDAEVAALASDTAGALEDKADESAVVAAQAAADAAQADADAANAALPAKANAADVYDKASADARFDAAITPEQYGAAGDGVTDDTAAFTAILGNVTALTARARPGAVYRLPSGVTLDRDMDLCGATLVVTGDVTLTNSASLRNGKVEATGRIYAANATGLAVSRVEFTSTSTASSGIVLSGCSDAVVSGCTVDGGYRGIVVENCDDVTIERNTVLGQTAEGAYGILARATSGTHRGIHIIGNRVFDAMFGITVHGGEANSANGGYTGDYRFEDVVIVGNHVEVSAPDTYVGCIWATCSKRITVVANTVQGGRDVGIDFEHCSDSSATGNIVNDIRFGGLSAIYGCDNILFAANVVTYTRASAAFTPDSITAPNTNNLPTMIKGGGTDITFRGNTFASKSGALSRGTFGYQGGTRITYEGNDFLNTYFVEANSTFGNAVDIAIRHNRFTFDIALDWPLLRHERVDGFYVEGNTVEFASGETGGFGSSSPYIGVYDSGTGSSTRVYLRDNRVEGAASTNNTLGIHSNNAALVGAVEGNLATRVGATFGVSYTALHFANNHSATNPNGILRAGAPDNASALVTHRPAVSLTTTTQTGTTWTVNPGPDLLLYSGSSAATWTLPTASYTGGVVRIKNIGTGTLTVSRAGSDVIHTASALNATSVTLTSGQSVTMFASGAVWMVI